MGQSAEKKSAEKDRRKDVRARTYGASRVCRQGASGCSNQPEARERLSGSEGRLRRHPPLQSRVSAPGGVVTRLDRRWRACQGRRSRQGKRLGQGKRPHNGKRPGQGKSPRDRKSTHLNSI